MFRQLIYIYRKHTNVESRRGGNLLVPDYFSPKRKITPALRRRLFCRHFAVRALEADYYRTQFSNGLNDRQNNLRLSAGVIFRFGEK